MQNTLSINSTFQLPSLLRRLSCLLYETLLVIAIVFIFSFLFSSLAQFKGKGALVNVFQIYIFLVMAIYFSWFWSKGRSTLAMKTWKLKIVEKNGQPISPKKAFLRYCFAWLSVTGISILWALIDREGLYLHDRLAGTKLVSTQSY